MFKEGQIVICISDVYECKEGKTYLVKKDSEGSLYVGENEEEGIYLAYSNDEEQTFSCLFGKPSIRYFAVKFELKKAITDLFKYYPMVTDLYSLTTHLGVKEREDRFFISNLRISKVYELLRDGDYIYIDRRGEYHSIKKEELENM
ncbi:hypothetical protein ACGWY0_002730 [Enterococcus hirae]